MGVADSIMIMTTSSGSDQTRIIGIGIDCLDAMMMMAHFRRPVVLVVFELGV